MGWKPVHIASNIGIVKDEGVNLSWGRSEESAGFPGAGQRRTAGEAAALKVGLSSGFTTKSFEFCPWGLVQSVQTGIRDLEEHTKSLKNGRGQPYRTRQASQGGLSWNCVEVPHPS